MSASFPSEDPAKMDRYLAMLEAGAYPTAMGAPVMHQAPIYAMAEVPSPAEFLLPGPGQTRDMVTAAVNPQRREAMRRLLPMWRY